MNLEGENHDLRTGYWAQGLNRIWTDLNLKRTIFDHGVQYFHHTFEGFRLGFGVNMEHGTWYMVKLEHGPRINFKNMPEVNDNLRRKII